jgi:hypothetical protein
MTLGEKQRKFSLMLAKLIIYAYEQGYEITFGDVWAKIGHKINSNHYIRLAADLNLFKDGVFIVSGAGHDLLHDYWDTLGGAERIENDMNHYSVEYKGSR